MTPLFPYQVTGAEFLASRRFALLADEPRVGKTPAAIAACDIINARSILVICPAVARADWVRKFQEYSIFSRRATPVFNRVDPFATEMVVVSYALSDMAVLWRNWDVLILDEDHNLKSPNAKRTKNILGTNGIAHGAQRVWFIGGTPAPNNASELWVRLYVAGIYKGEYDQFLRDFCVGYMGDYGLVITGTKNADKLAKLLEGFMLRRTFAEVRPEIPPMVYEDYVVTCDKSWRPNFPAKERRANDMLEAALADERNPIRALEENYPHLASLRRMIGLMKVEPMAQRVEQLDLPKLVIFAIHKDVITQLAKRLSEFNPVLLTGETPEQQREVVKHTFTHDKNCRVFIGQVIACGTNVDLSAANHSCIMEPDYVPGNNKQAALRIQNVNKIEPNFCEFIGLANSVDEKVSCILRRKAADISTFIPN